MAAERCSFCLRERREVRALVAGEKAMICEECIALCVGVVEETANANDSLRTLVASLMNVTSALARRRRLADALRVAGAATAVAAGRRDLLMDVARGCVGVRLVPAARVALQAIAVTGRDDAWHLYACVLEYRLGNYDGADAHLDHIEAGRASAEDWALARLNRISCRLRREPPPGRAELRDLLGRLLELAEVLPEGYGDVVAKDRAECLLLLGDARGAVKLLREQPQPLAHEAQSVLGEALWAIGDEAGAQAAWTQLAEGPPELAATRRAIRRLAAPPERLGPYRSPG